VRLNSAFGHHLPEKGVQLFPVARFCRRKELFNLGRHTDIQLARNPVKHLAPGARELGRPAGYDLLGRFSRKRLGAAGMQSCSPVPTVTPPSSITLLSIY
jgi:hypothetical protein